jgi:ATP-dependent DNA ligase
MYGDNMKFMEPTKPKPSCTSILKHIDDSYIIESKLDGWRLEISVENDKIITVSRKNKSLPIPEFLKEKLLKLIPNGCSIDCEWINPSRIKAINKELNTSLPEINCISIFDITWFQGLCLKNTNLKNRRSIEIFSSLPEVNTKEIADGAIFKSPYVLGSKANQFIEEQKNQPLSEGVVIKDLDGNIGSTWFKIKHR